MANKKTMKREILAVLEYKSSEDSCNSVYVGSMALSRVYSFLGSYYGSPTSITSLLETADSASIQLTHDYLSTYIDFMKKNPVNHCPKCGQIVRKTK
jgi:hypothetical protein